MLIKQGFAFVSLIVFTLTSHSSDQVITFKSGNLTLVGSLSLPDSKSNSLNPCVLLLPGSGPTDRDGNQPGLRTDFLKQIATHLSSRGIVSLRFDKRAVRTYKNFWPQDINELNEFFSWQNFKKDIKAAFEQLRRAPGINPRSCSILGHSEGGTFALDVSSELQPKSLILMATPGRPLRDVLKEQIAQLLERQNASDDQKKYYMSELTRIISQVELSGKIPNDVPLGLRALFPQGAGHFLQTDLSFEPSIKILSLKAPILILNGLADLQVSPERDADVLFKHGKQRKNLKTDIRFFEGLGHGFSRGKNKESGNVDDSVSPGVLEALSSWLIGGRIL